MMKRIEDYLLGRLNRQEIDELWIEFIKDPEWFDLFEIEASLRHIARQVGINNVNAL